MARKESIGRQFGKIREVVDTLRADRRPFCTAVVPAAGSSLRMGGSDKLMIPLNGKPVLLYTMEALEACTEIDEIIVAVKAEKREEIWDLLDAQHYGKLKLVIAGGDSREDTVRQCILAADPQTQLIAVHDGARPLATSEMIGRVVRMAARTHAAIAAVPVKDTVKRVSNGHITETPERSELYAAQTPQVFDKDLLAGAYVNAARCKIKCTDDAMAVESLGVSVAICEGEYDNLKITTPVDIFAAESILRNRKTADSEA